MRASPLVRRVLAAVSARDAESDLQILNSDDLTDSALGPPEEEQLEERRLRLRHGLTNMQRLFLFGKLSRVDRQRCSTRRRLFVERGREHSAKDLETPACRRV